MHEMQTIVIDEHSVCLSVCLSRGSTWLHCAKNGRGDQDAVGGEYTWGSVKHCVRRGGVLIPHREGSRDLLLNFGSPLISPEWLKLGTRNFVCVANENYTKLGQRRSAVGSRDLILVLGPPYISWEQLQLKSSASAVCVVHSMQLSPDYFVLFL